MMFPISRSAEKSSIVTPNAGMMTTYQILP